MPPTKDSEHIIFAHRGGSFEAPENTLQSFLHSNKIGAIIETDVRITKDGKIIICHDETFDRLCNRNSLTHINQKVKETLSTDLPVFKEKMPLHFSNDQFYDRKEGD